MTVFAVISEQGKAKGDLGYSSTVAYAEIFHGGFQSVAYGGHLFVVGSLCDVTI